MREEDVEDDVDGKNLLSIRNPCTTNGCVIDFDKITELNKIAAVRNQRSVDAAAITARKNNKVNNRTVDTAKMFSSFCSYITSSTNILSNGKSSYTAMDTKDLIFISKTYLKATIDIKNKKEACAFIDHYLSNTIDAVEIICAQNRL
jgi:hypothetical protein